MADRYNKKRPVKKFSVGDSVSVRIPRIDRTNSDLPWLPCIIVQVQGKAQHLYRLRLGKIRNVVHISCNIFIGVSME